MNEELQSKAIKIIKEGGVVVFPTDTAFGVGCRFDDEKAVKRIFSIKNRSEMQPLPILVNSISMAKEYFAPVSVKVDNLLNRHWPGALTVVFNSRESVPVFVRGGETTVGIRMPNHPFPLALIEAIGVPLATTSANFHGEATPYKTEDIDPGFAKLVDLVVPGSCPVGLSSTIVNCSREPWEVIRQGAVTIDEALY